MAIELSVLGCTASDYPLVPSNFCPLCFLSFDLRFWLPLWYFQTFAHCVVYPLIYGFWLPLWYFQTFAHCVVYPLIYDFWLPFGILWPLSFLSLDVRLLIILWYLQTFAHCVVYPLIYGFWLPFGIFHLLPIVLSILWFTASDYLFGIFKLLPIVLSILWFTASDYLFGILKLLPIVFSILWFTASDYTLVSSNLCPLCCLSFDLRLLITVLVSPNISCRTLIHRDGIVGYNMH